MKKTTFLWTALFVISFSSLAFAFDGTQASSDMPPMLKGILTGVIGGVIAGFLGWSKNRDTKTGEMQKFEFQYLWPTLLVGALVGAASYWLKKEPKDIVASLEASPIYAGIIFGAEALLKTIWRNSAVTLRGILSDVKSGGNPPTA